MSLGLQVAVLKKGDLHELLNWFFNLLIKENFPAKLYIGEYIYYIHTVKIKPVCKFTNHRIFLWFFAAILRNTYTFTSSFSAKLREIVVSISFHHLQICSTKVNSGLKFIESKLTSHKKADFLFKNIYTDIGINLWWILLLDKSHSCKKCPKNVQYKTYTLVTDPKSFAWVLCPRSLILGPGSWILGLRSWFLDYGPWSCVPKCDKNYKVWGLLQTIIKKCCRYYEVWLLLQSEMLGIRLD